jgi:hypothetical protein
MFTIRISVLLDVTLMVTTVLPMPIPRTTITLSGTPWGTSPCDVGATEGNVRFDMADLQAAGITTYRLYGGMSRGEWHDDDGIYSAPTIADIKANPHG